MKRLLLLDKRVTRMILVKMTLSTDCIPGNDGVVRYSWSQLLILLLIRALISKPFYAWGINKVPTK